MSEISKLLTPKPNGHRAMFPGLEITIGDADDWGRRELTAIRNGKTYLDKIDAAKDTERTRAAGRIFSELDFSDRYNPSGVDNSQEIAEINRLIVEAWQQPVVTDGAKAERFPLITSAALDSEDYTPSPIITETLFAGSPAVIGGMFKTGKTLLGVDASTSIATGRMFLGAYTVPEPRGVVYFTGEGGPAVAQEYGRRVAASKGIALADVTQLHWCFSVPRLEDLRDLDEFAKVLDTTGAEVAVIDNLMLTMSGDKAGNVYSMGGIFSNAIRICSERGVTPIFVHHFKRTRATADPYAPGELADLTQAGVAEIAGQWLLLTRREAYNPADAGEHKLWLTIGGRMGHSSLAALDVHEGSRADPGGRRWEVDVLRPEDVRKDAENRQEQSKRQRAEDRAAAILESDQKELVKIMARLKTPQTKSDLRNRIPFGHGRFDRAFASLASDGILEPTETTKGNNRTFEAWKLRESEDENKP